MIIESERQVTDAVIEEMRRTPNARTKVILECLVRHLHAFVREARLTEEEFDRAIHIVSALGQRTTESHNETRLMAGSLGLSTLVCLLNNGDNAAIESSANLLGPFGGPIRPGPQTGVLSSDLRLQDHPFSLKDGCATRKESQLWERRWMSGTHPLSASTKVKIRSRQK